MTPRWFQAALISAALMRTALISTTQLLANASDVDGDTLSVVDLKIASGKGNLKANPDGTWTFTPSSD